MTKKYDRKFGEIPDWAKKGDITIENFDLRMEEYGVKAGLKDNWPFLSRVENIPSTANAGAWDLYFRDVLGGFPKTYRNYRDGVTSAINLPEKHPGDFDARFYKLKDAALADLEPEPPFDGWKHIISSVESLEERQKVSQRILADWRAAMASHRFEPHNVFVPTFAPQYQAMVARGGRPGVSLEDSTRHGVWVPFRWLDTNPTAPGAWKQAGI